MSRSTISIAFAVMISIIGCSPSYELRHYNGTHIKGWAVISGDGIYTSFTADENGILPEEKEVARARFDRRKDFLEKFHKIENPGTAALKQVPLIPVGVVLFPVFIADEYRVHVFGKGHEISNEKREKIDSEWAAQQKILKEFIDADMIKERATRPSSLKREDEQGVTTMRAPS